MFAIKRFVFAVGFVVGLLGFVLIVGNVLLYLLTGKLPSVEMDENERPVFGLIAPQDVVTLVKEQRDAMRDR